MENWLEANFSTGFAECRYAVAGKMISVNSITLNTR
jgi:hypothetical protein